MNSDKNKEARYNALGWKISIGSIGIYVLLSILVALSCGGFAFFGCTGFDVATQLISLPIIFILLYICYILYGWLVLRMSLYRAAFPVLAIPVIFLASTFSTQLSSTQRNNKERVATFEDIYGHLDEAINSIELGKMRFLIKETSQKYDVIFIFPMNLSQPINMYHPVIDNSGVVAIEIPDQNECRFTNSIRCLRSLKTGDQICEIYDDLGRKDATKSARLVGEYELVESHSIGKQGCSMEMLNSYINKIMYKKRNYQEFIRCDALHMQPGFQFGDPCD